MFDFGCCPAQSVGVTTREPLVWDTLIRGHPWCSTTWQARVSIACPPAGAFLSVRWSTARVLVTASLEISSLETLQKPARLAQDDSVALVCPRERHASERWRQINQTLLAIKLTTTPKGRISRPSGHYLESARTRDRAGISGSPVSLHFPCYALLFRVNMPWPNCTAPLRLFTGSSRPQGRSSGYRPAISGPPCSYLAPQPFA